ncbi:MAG: S9 family peptidase, partial [Bryobacteraceae bacterium]
MKSRTWLLIFLSSAALAQKKPVTIEAAATTPRVRSAVTWAPDGKRFAFRQGRSIWQYEVASGLKKELASLAELEGKAVKGPAPEAFAWRNRRVTERAFDWSSSGREMLVSESGDLFLVRLETGKWEQLTATAEPEHDPKLSPDARLVSFRRGHDLYTLEIEGGKLHRLTTDGSSTLLNGELDWVYPEELALGTAYWWSPDSARIAYLQLDVSREPIFPHADLLSPRARYEPQRYPKAGEPNADVRLGVVAAKGGATRWMDLGDPRDALLARVAWLPGSKRVSVQRLNRVQNRLDLLAADAANGTATVLLHEQDPYWINVKDDLQFLKDGRHFLWGSERDGFRHLYLYEIADSGPAKGKQITRGEWEVTDTACVDEGAKQIYYVGSAESPLERQFYRIGFDGKRSQRLSSAAGTHAISMAPTCEFYIDSHSSLTSPAARTLHSRDGKQIAVYQEADRRVADEYELLPTEIVKVKAADGALMYARLIRPSGFTESKKYPAVVMVYGGPHAQAVRNTWAGATWDQALAHRGFVIWQLDNRGSAGRGHAWESAVFRNLGAKEVEDQKEGVRHLVSMGFVDSARIGIYGWSYGGYMTLNSLANAPDIFRAGIAGAPVTDWRNYDTIYTERYMGLPQDNAAAYERSSPVNKAASIQAKLMLVHNFEDDNVHFQNTLQMIDKLERAGKRFELLLYP